MKITANYSLSLQRHRCCRLSDFCSSLCFTGGNSPARLSSSSIFPIGRLATTESPLVNTYPHYKAHSYQSFSRRSGVSFMNSGPDFSINPLSVGAEAEAAKDRDVDHIEERREDLSRGLALEEPESGNSFSALEEAGVGIGDSGREESAVAVEDNEGSVGRTESSVKRVLPEELASSVMKLTCESTAPDNGGVCDVYLVGTAHVSTESCKQVEAVISSLQPQVVFLELCSSRVNILQPRNLKVPTMGEMMDMWKKNQNLFGILYSWFLAKVASQLEVMPGAEFRVAYEEAMKYEGKVILGDRPVQITLRRTWAKMPLWHKTKLLSALLFQAFSLPNPDDLNRMLKEMDDIDMLTLVIQEMSKKFPTLMETLVHERDRYMSSTLLRVASEHSSVVAVVGKGHLPGISKYWNQPVEIKELLTIPTKRPVFSVKKIITTVGVAVAGVAIVSGLYLSSKK